jgi:hypothetical protein
VNRHRLKCTEVWDVPQAIEYMKKLEPVKPWFIEEPTAPDDAVGHAAIRKALKPYGIGVATGEHAHNRVRLFLSSIYSTSSLSCPDLASISRSVDQDRKLINR